MTYFDLAGYLRTRICTKMVQTVDDVSSALSSLDISMYASFYMKAAFYSLKNSFP